VIDQINAQGKRGAELIDALLNATDEAGRPLIANCPGCHEERSLYLSFEEYGSPIVAIVGGRRAGKTCYIGTLRKRLKQLDELKVTFSPARGARNIEDIYRRLEFRKELPIPDDLVEVDTLIPCSIGIGRESAPLRSSSKSVVTYNVAGEAFEPVQNARDDIQFVSQVEQYARYVGSEMTRGILMIVDPYTCFPIRESMEERLPEQVYTDIATNPGTRGYENWQDYAPEEILRIITTYININRSSRDSKIPINLALVLAKLDVFLSDGVEEEVNHAAKQYVETIEGIHEGLMDTILVQSNAVELHCSKAHKAALALFKALNIQDLYREASANFARVSCFAVSSLGQTPESEKLEKPLDPIGVEIPFLWLFQHAIDPQNR
jgi:hypothetical protein